MTPTRYRRHIIGMSGRIFVAPHHSTEDLERRYKAADDGVERGHLHIIWLLSQGRSAKFVAEVTGYTPTSKILWRYNDHGLAGLGDGRLDNPGAAPLLDEAQLEALRDSEPPPDGGPGARWRAGSAGGSGAKCRRSGGSNPGPAWPGRGSCRGPPIPRPACTS